MCLEAIPLEHLVPYEPSVIREHLQSLTSLLAEYDPVEKTAQDIFNSINHPPLTVVQMGEYWLLVHGIHRALLLRMLGAATALCAVTTQTQPDYELTLQTRLSSGMQGLNNVPVDQTDDDRKKRTLLEMHEVHGLPLDPDLYEDESGD